MMDAFVPEVEFETSCWKKGSPENKLPNHFYLKRLFLLRLLVFAFFISFNIDNLNICHQISATRARIKRCSFIPLKFKKSEKNFSLFLLRYKLFNDFYSFNNNAHNGNVIKIVGVFAHFFL